MSQLQTQQLMTSQIRSHVEYSIHTNNILVLILYSKLMKNVAAMTIFNTIKWWLLIVAYFFGPPCMYILLNIICFMLHGSDLAPLSNVYVARS